MDSLEARTEIARLLTGRCTNCFHEHPFKAMKFVDGNVGPFCPDCWKILWHSVVLPRLKQIHELLTCWPPSNADKGCEQLESLIEELER